MTPLVRAMIAAENHGYLQMMHIPEIENRQMDLGQLVYARLSHVM